MDCQTGQTLQVVNGFLLSYFSKVVENLGSFSGCFMFFLERYYFLNVIFN